MSLVLSTSRSVILSTSILVFSYPANAEPAKEPRDSSAHSVRPKLEQLQPELGQSLSSEQQDAILLASSGKAACSIFTVGGADSSALINLAVQSIAGTVKRWSAVDLPAVEVKTGKRISKAPGIVLATLDELIAVAPDVVSKNSEISRIKTADEQGFAIAPVGGKVFVVSRSVRGVYNGAVYVRDFLIDGPTDRLTLTTKPILREPAMKGQAAYTLSIWGNDAEYTASDWKSIFQAYARDGIDRVYFWVSGHFPSKKFPQTYKCADGPWDTTVNSRIGTIADLRAIIRHAHDLGLKLYLGGGMGGWCGTGLITNKKPGTMKTGPDDAPDSLCPSNPESRDALTQYYVEMFDALPEADGVYIELAEEWGECLCAECSKPIDKWGSKQFGRSLLTLAQGIADKIRSKHPHARFAFTVGYDEHAHDPAFYEMIRDMGDEHYEWMEARGRWEFAGPDGKDLPVSYFSRHVMKWKQWYNLSLETLVKEANRAARSDFYGLITSFEPGFASGSFYKTIPFPTDLLPYILTGFACREMTWEPTLSLADLKQRVQARFFGGDAPKGLTDDLWALREIIRASTGKHPMSKARLSQLARIAGAVEAAWPSSSPKTREGLELMRKAIVDTQRHVGLRQNSP